MGTFLQENGSVDRQKMKIKSNYDIISFLGILILWLRNY